jgi:class 3 adenylate cyclase
VFLNNIAEIFRIRAEQKNISFRYTPLSLLPTLVRGDEQKLRQILINLLGAHAFAIAEMALDMQAEMVRVGEQTSEPFRLRIGINSGPVIAGVIGIKKFFYDLWGDTVNVASRMESQGIAGAIQVTAATYELLRDKYLFEERGVIFVKGKEDMTTYLLIGK